MFKTITALSINDVYYIYLSDIVPLGFFHEVYTGQ